MTCNPSMILLQNIGNTYNYYCKREDTAHNRTDYASDRRLASVTSGSDVRLASGSDMPRASCKRK